MKVIALFLFSQGLIASNVISFDLTDEQQCLLANLYFEANNEPLLGKIAVAQVVNKRVTCPYYSDTICGVVKDGMGQDDGCAFSWLCDQKENNIFLLDEASIESWNENIQISLQMTSSEPFFINDLAAATLYHADYINPWWADSPKVHFLGKIGAHMFYSEDNICD